MLTHPTLDKIVGMKLWGMAKALEEQRRMPEVESLSFEERLGLLVDREVTERRNRKLRLRLKKARLRLAACLEDLDFRHPRGLDKALLLELGSCRWIGDRHNVLITGPTGVGKSYLACALGQKACREGFRTLYFRLSRLQEDLQIARGDGRFGKILASLAKVDLLILDDWGLTPWDDPGRRNILEILEDRHQLRSTIVSSQMPVAAWHEMTGDPPLADAILARLVHNAHNIEVKGDSMRKTHKTLTQNGH